MTLVIGLNKNKRLFCINNTHQTFSKCQWHKQNTNLIFKKYNLHDHIPLLQNPVEVRNTLSIVKLISLQILFILNSVHLNQMIFICQFVFTNLFYNLRFSLLILVSNFYPTYLNHFSLLTHHISFFYQLLQWKMIFLFIFPRFFSFSYKFLLLYLN